MVTKKAAGVGVAVPLIIVFVFVCALFIYPPPTDQLENIYIHLNANTSGDGPGIGIAFVDPLTDIIFCEEDVEFTVTFIILSPDFRGIDYSSILYSYSADIVVDDIERIDGETSDWMVCHFTVQMTKQTKEMSHFTINVNDDYGHRSSRLFYVIALG